VGRDTDPGQAFAEPSIKPRVIFDNLGGDQLTDNSCPGVMAIFQVAIFNQSRNVRFADGVSLGVVWTQQRKGNASYRIVGTWARYIVFAPSANIRFSEMDPFKLNQGFPQFVILRNRVHKSFRFLEAS
jgi:hypothetical protein